jgi:drug/metabolite transporter (DMT)-like permease
MDGGQNLAGRGGAGRQGLNGSDNGSSISKRTAAGLTLTSVVLWGFSPIGTRYMVGIGHAALPALAFTGLRYTIAALLFAPFLWQARQWTKRDLWLGALCGVVGICGFNLPAALGQRTVSAGLTGLLDGIEPLMIVIFTAIALRRRPSNWTIGASAIGLTGIVLLAHGSGPALGDPLGIALVLTGAVLWGLYCVLVPPLINARGALPATAVTMAFGALPLLAAGLPDTPHMMQTMTAFQWELTFVLILGTSVTSMLCWNAGSAVLGAEQAGWFLYLLPLVSLIGGAIILGEPVKLIEIFGGALILLSVFLSQR